MTDHFTSLNAMSNKFDMAVSHHSESEAFEEHPFFQFSDSPKTDIVVGPSFTELLGGDEQDNQLFAALSSPVANRSPLATSSGVAHQENRVWKVVASKLNLSELSVKLKTRRDAPSEFIPERLYSSLKYELHLTAVGDSIKNLPFLLARATVVDSQTLEKVQLNNNASVLKGDIEASMSKVPNGADDIVKGMLKIQLNSELSYHHEKRLLCLVVEFFEPESLDSPVVIARSALVKCYARKPNKKNPKKKGSVGASDSNKKRKKNKVSLDEDEEEDTDVDQSEESPAKKLRQSPSPHVAVENNNFNSAAPASMESVFHGFKKKLDELMDSNSSQSDDVRFMCLSYLLQKILTSDPLAAKMLMPHIVNPFGMIQQPFAFNLHSVQPIPASPVMTEEQSCAPAVATPDVDAFEADLLEFADEFFD